MKALWKNVILAESDKTIIIEGNHYFPPESVNKKFFIESNNHTRCGWKGVASYYTIKIDNEENKDSAWYYDKPLDKAKHITNYVAFWKGIQIES
ncbi:MAG TPA: DUF427 domain-containing protein [Nitrososphaeraceae archaeon]|jgi:uncharacterized protein (DUF427 family)|nr:DUF427 domain-containing protein [Nitrososphaeraceae archaeon]